MSYGYKQFLNRGKKTWIVLGLVALVLCVTLSVLVVRRPRLSPSEKPITAGTTTPNVATPSDQMGAELVTIKRFGFEPAKITRPHGSFVLEVDNRAEVAAVDLRLDRVAGANLRQVHVPREKLDWIEILRDLPSGEYRLTEANHPDWVCRITLTQ